MKSPWLWKTLGGVVLVGLLSGCTPSLQSDDPQERIKALQAVTDQNVFLQTALTDSDKGVQMEAVKHLTDQSALSQYLEKTSSNNAPDGALQLALSKLTDTDEIFKLATGNYSCAPDAVGKITDKATLIKVGSTALDNDAVMAAINKVSDDPTALYHIAIQGAPWNAQQIINKTTDQTLLAQIAQAPPAADPNDQNDLNQARAMAVAKLTDQTLLTNLALNDKDSGVRSAAVNQLTDLPTLLKIGQNDPDLNVEGRAYERIGSLGDKSAVPLLLALLPDWDSNADIVSTLTTLGWAPSNEAEQVYKWISDRDSKDLLAQWDETSRVLFADVQTGDARKTTNALNAIICVGKTDAIPQLIQILNGSTDVHIAENFMNSGNDDLKNAAQAWGKTNGYEFVKQTVDPNDGKQAVNWGKW